MGSSSSRPFSTLAQPLDGGLHPDPEADPEADPQADPDQLLRQCAEALRGRPARPRRELVSSRAPGNCCRHSASPRVRVLQWNVLAQGERAVRPSVRLTVWIHSPLGQLHYGKDHCHDYFGQY